MARRMRVVASGLAGLMLGLVVMALVSRDPARTAQDGSSLLEPDREAIRYRHPVAPKKPANSMATIQALEARVKDAPNPFDLTELAELYYQNAREQGDPRQYAASEAAAKRSLALLAHPNRARLILAKIANTHHEFRKAIDLARGGDGTRPGADAYVVIATAHLALGEPTAAIEAADAAVAMKASVTTYLTRALVLQGQGRDAEAASDFARAAALERPGDPSGAARVRALWGRFLLRRGEYEGASALIAEALRIAPGLPLAVAQRGELELRTGRSQTAIKSFEEAFLTSRELRYLIDQARAVEVSGDAGRADQLRAQAEALARRELTDHGLGHRLDLVEILVERGEREQLEEAVTVAREELKTRQSFEVRFQLARALSRLERRDEALRQIHSALALGATEAQVYELAAHLEEKKHPARAAMYRRLADRFDPSGTGWRRLGVGPP